MSDALRTPRKPAGSGWKGGDEGRGGGVNGGGREGGIGGTSGGVGNVNGIWNVSVPLDPLASVKLCSKPLQTAPFHPSPKLSIMFKVQISPLTAFMLPLNGAPPETDTPLGQETVQLTSLG